jgi:hypothetical protein
MLKFGTQILRPRIQFKDAPNKLKEEQYCAECVRVELKLTHPSGLCGRAIKAAVE